MAPRQPIQALLVLATLILSACAAPVPTAAPNAVVHFRNFSGSALFVGVTSGESRQEAVLRPCGGEAAFAVLAPPTDDPRVMMGALFDATGVFDGVVAQLPEESIDLEELPDMTFTGPIWSRGDIGIEDMPQWITFRAGTTEQSGASPTDTAPPSCEPWPNSE